MQKHIYAYNTHKQQTIKIVSTIPQQNLHNATFNVIGIAQQIQQLQQKLDIVAHKQQLQAVATQQSDRIPDVSFQQTGNGLDLVNRTQQIMNLDRIPSLYPDNQPQFPILTDEFQYEAEERNLPPFDSSIYTTTYPLIENEIVFNNNTPPLFIATNPQLQTTTTTQYNKIIEDKEKDESNAQVKVKFPFTLQNKSHIYNIYNINRVAILLNNQKENANKSPQSQKKKYCYKQKR